MVARLLIQLTVGRHIPISLRDQALWWVKYYHPNQQPSVYEEKVKRFENDKSKRVCILYFLNCLNSFWN